jgi:RNA polymerase sigma factor (sigma-70 family)
MFMMPENAPPEREPLQALVRSFQGEDSALSGSAPQDSTSEQAQLKSDPVQALVPSLQSDNEALINSAVEELARLRGTWIKTQVMTSFGLDDHDSEDVLQGTLYNVWRFRKDYDPQRSCLSTWFLRIAINCAIDLLRKRRKESRTIDSKKADSLPRECNEPRGPLSPAEEVIRKIVARLDEPQQRILFVGSHSDASQRWAHDLALEFAAEGIRDKHEKAYTAGRIRGLWHRLKKTIKQEMRNGGFAPDSA